MTTSEKTRDHEAAATGYLYRNDVPAGSVPEYREFVRLLWAWHNESDEPCISSPPWVYSIRIRDSVEIATASSLLKTIYQVNSSESRYQIVTGTSEEEGSVFYFANLDILHSFLHSCAAIGATNDTARLVCEYIMWTLGFRWV